MSNSRLPPFNYSDRQAWFQQVEGILRRRGYVSEFDLFTNVLQILPPDVAQHVRHLIRMPERSYSEMKRIICNLGETPSPNSSNDEHGNNANAHETNNAECEVVHVVLIRSQSNRSNRRNN